MSSQKSTVVKDELQKLCDQARGILTVVIESQDLDESNQHALSAVRDLVFRIDVLHTELNSSVRKDTPLD